MVDINDNPMARARLSALMAAVVIERSVQIETIPHVTPRDASIMGLQSQLLGAHAEGVRNVLAVTGDPPHVGDYPGSSGVYDVDAIGLVSLLGHLNRGEDFSGKAIDAPTSFYIGRGREPVRRRPRPRARALPGEGRRGRALRHDAGALRSRLPRPFLDRLGGESPIPLLVGVWPLTSYQLAFRLHNEVPGITIPEAVQERLADGRRGRARASASSSRGGCAEGARSRRPGSTSSRRSRSPGAALELLSA